MMRWVAVLAAGAIFMLPDAPRAQTFPERTVRIVIPFGPSGGNDIVARVLATKLSETVGQPVIVDNRPGGQGMLAGEIVMRAPPDGHTLLMGPSGTMTANPAVYTKMPYHPQRDFAPVTMIGSFPLILVVNATLPVKSVQELIEYAKARPANINYGSTTALFQLASELFNQRAGTRFQHIPYKSSAEFVNAVLANEITIVFSDPPPATGQIKSGRLRALGVTAAKRHPSFPDVPTMAEAGIPDMAFLVWMGLFVPVATPAALVKRWRDEVVRVLAMPDVKERLAGLGVDPSGMQSDEFAKVIAEDIARWTAVAKVANIKAD